MQSNPFTMLPKLEPPGIHQLRALAAAGWQLDIRQWGIATGGGNFTIPMNIDFSDSMLFANAINIGQLSSTVDWQIWARSTSSFEVYSSKTGSLGWLWVAIGK